jgi:hypothetical protein
MYNPGSITNNEYNGGVIVEAQNQVFDIPSDRTFFHTYTQQRIRRFR